MGSSGSGNFSDYSGSISNPSQNGGSSGGSSGSDRCAQAFSVSLEEINFFDYYRINQNVPPYGTRLSLEIKGRIVAVDDNGLTVGALPTKLNYIASCIKDGFSYVGIVQSSSSGSMPSIVVDFAPS